MATQVNDKFPPPQVTADYEAAQSAEEKAAWKDFEVHDDELSDQTAEALILLANEMGTPPDPVGVASSVALLTQTVDAIVGLLIAKGVITPSEYQAAVLHGREKGLAMIAEAVVEQRRSSKRTSTKAQRTQN